MKRITNIEKLKRVLRDHEWHDTRELARRVGHTFGTAKMHLVGVRHHWDIETRRHPKHPKQWQYRLVIPRD